MNLAKLLHQVLDLKFSLSATVKVELIFDSLLPVQNCAISWLGILTASHSHLKNSSTAFHQ